MTSITRARRFLPALAVGAAAMGLGTPEAKAQFIGPGMWGWGWGGFHQVPSPTNFLNDHALVNAARAGRPPSNNVYAGNPNSYVNRLRDNSFTPSYNVQRRRPSTAAAPPVDLGPSLGRAPAPAAPAAPRMDRVAAAPALSSFFDAGRRLVWPADAPTDGDLKPKRDASDQASLAVLDDVLAHGVASVALATDARQKLLDYGRPALQEIREKATPVVADTFHAFLLSLYDSLRKAATAP
jgi:hypothetical protein